ARAHDVVGAHRNEIDPDGRASARRPRDLQLGPHAVGGGREQSAVPDREQPGEPADGVGDLRTARAGGEVGDQRDGLRRGLGIDARRAVGVAHPVGSWSWSSSTNLPAPSGISIGYSPSKHARQNESFSPPAAWTIPSSERYPSESAPT